MQDAAEEVNELNRQRLVEAELLAQRLDLVGVGLDPNNRISAGSPGIRYRTRKTRIETPSRTGMANSNLRAMKFSTGRLAELLDNTPS